MTFGPYPATVIKLHDGDTIIVDLDLGFGIHSVDIHCRVYGINAPELITPEGKTSLAFAQQLLAIGAQIKIISHGWDKFGGRFDGAVIMGDGRNFSDVMINAGMAVPFYGLKPLPQ
jgi:endonuclease YncB( thermonuclease family)